MKDIEWKNNPIIKKELLREDIENIFPVCISDSEFIDIIIEYLLGKNWYVTDPISHEQINTKVLHEILLKHSKIYREELKDYNKKLKQLNSEYNSKSKIINILREACK